MTRKDYVAIAAAVQELRELPTVRENPSVLIGVEMTALTVSQVCAEDNNCFDKGRFLRACGIL